MNYGKIMLFALIMFGCTKDVIFSQEKELRERVEFNVDNLYSGVYSEVLEQPLEVYYTILCPAGNASRAGMNFKTVDGFHTSDDDDYSNNIWDKGHLAPAAAFSCDKEMLRKTFSYLNSALMHEGLNRGQWNQLESFERDLGNFYDVQVTIKVLFEGNVQKLQSGATVPSGFIKVLRFGDKEITFKFPNTDTKGTDWIDYRIN